MFNVPENTIAKLRELPRDDVLSRRERFKSTVNVMKWLTLGVALCTGVVGLMSFFGGHFGAGQSALMLACLAIMVLGIHVFMMHIWFIDLVLSGKP